MGFWGFFFSADDQVKCVLEKLICGTFFFYLFVVQLLRRIVVSVSNLYTDIQSGGHRQTDV